MNRTRKVLLGCLLAGLAIYYPIEVLVEICAGALVSGVSGSTRRSGGGGGPVPLARRRNELDEATDPDSRQV